MSIIELKEAATKLSQREREELQAFLLRLRHESPDWKRKAAQTVREMQAGKRVSLKAIRARIARARK